MRRLSRSRSSRLLTAVCLLVSAHFAIAYQTLTTAMVSFDPHRDLVGHGGPFAYRILPVLLWRACSFAGRLLLPILPGLHLPVLHRPFSSNEEWFTVLLTFFAMFGTLHISRRLLRAIAGEGRPEWFEWLALGMAYAAYFDTILVLNRSLYYPYDILALCLFTWLVELAYRQQPIMFLLVLLPAMLNKETAAVAVLIYFGLNFGQAAHTSTAKLKVFATSGGLLVSALAVRFAQRAYILHQCPACPTAMQSQLRENLHQLLNPLFWISEAAVFGFAYVAAIVLWRFVPAAIRTTAVAVCILWLGAMVFVGVLREVRIFSELSALLLLVVATGLQGWLVARRGQVSGLAGSSLAG